MDAVDPEPKIQQQLPEQDPPSQHDAPPQPRPQDADVGWLHDDPRFPKKVFPDTPLERLMELNDASVDDYMMKHARF